jgi:hypothetical protein
MTNIRCQTGLTFAACRDTVSSRLVTSFLSPKVKFMVKLRNAFALALGIFLLQALPARADDYTDIWWTAGGTESGWGVNIIQSQDFIFATFFVYAPAPAPNKTPIWYAGNLTRQTGGSFSGGLYQTTGTGLDMPWNPADNSATQVGNVTFTPTSTTTATLTYNVGGTIVNKNIARQTLTSIALGGTYYGTGVINTSNCTNPANNGRQIFDVDPVVSQATGSQLQIKMSLGSDTCTFSGNYLQEGLLFRIPTASYTCTSGINTSATLNEIKATSIGLEGRWTAANVGGCQEDASFAAVFP